MPQAGQATITRRAPLPRAEQEPHPYDAPDYDGTIDWKWLRQRFDCIEFLSRKYDDLEPEAQTAFETLEYAIVREIAECGARDLMGLKVKARALAHLHAGAEKIQLDTE